MTENEPTLEPDVLAAWVDLQQRTPCRKCKSTAWTLAAAMQWTHGGARVGIFLVLGRPEERVVAISFTCDGCQAVFERPAYSRVQLGQQSFPAISLEDLPASPVSPNVTLTSREEEGGEV